MKNRFQEIDDIRGISMIVMILIHTNAYLLSDKLAYITREISQFAVVAFLFCSTYLTIRRPYPATIPEFGFYLIKRLKRLLIPYYIFVVAYAVFMSLFANKTLPYSYLVQNVLLTGGIDFNWLVLLFVQLTFVTPLLQYLNDRHKGIFHGYTAIALMSSIYFLTHTPLPYFRVIMWLPWSLVIIYTMHFDKLWRSTRIIILVTLLFGLVYYATQQYVLIPAKHSLSMYANKYPPNIYHIAYSLFALNILYALSQWKVFAQKLVQPVIDFFSMYSYTIYFIHILIIEAVIRLMNVKTLHWFLFFVVITYLTAIAQLTYNAFMMRLQKYKKPN